MVKLVFVEQLVVTFGGIDDEMDMIGFGTLMVDCVEELEILRVEVVQLVVTFAEELLELDIRTRELGLMVVQLVITEVVEPPEHNEHGRVIVVRIETVVVVLRHGAAVTGGGMCPFMDGVRVVVTVLLPSVTVTGMRVGTGMTVVVTVLLPSVIVTRERVDLGVIVVVVVVVSSSVTVVVSLVVSEPSTVLGSEMTVLLPMEVIVLLPVEVIVLLRIVVVVGRGADVDSRTVDDRSGAEDVELTKYGRVALFVNLTLGLDMLLEVVVLFCTN